MTIVVQKKDSKNLKKILEEKINKSQKGGGLSKHFGKLKRNLDGLKYQKILRNN